MRAQIEYGAGGSGRAGGAPFIPLDGRVANEPSELLGERAAREGDGEAALLLDGLLLSLDDEVGKRLDEGIIRRKRVEDGRVGWVVNGGHGRLVWCGGDGGWSYSNS